MAADVIVVTNVTGTIVPLPRGVILPGGGQHVYQQRDLEAHPYVADHLAKAVNAGLVAAVNFEGEFLTPSRILAIARGIHAHTHDEIVGIDPFSQPVTPFDHEQLRQLIHFIDDGPAHGFLSGAFRETLPSGDPFPTEVIWWESSAKLKRIVDLAITRATTQEPTQERWRMYDGDGATVIETVTDSIVYSGPFESTRTRTIAP